MSASSIRRRQVLKRRAAKAKRREADRANAAPPSASDICVGHLDYSPEADAFLKRMAAGGVEYAPIELPGGVITNRKAIPSLITIILDEVERSGPLPRGSRFAQALVGLAELGYFDRADAELMLRPRADDQRFCTRA